MKAIRRWKMKEYQNTFLLKTEATQKLWNKPKHSINKSNHTTHSLVYKTTHSDKLHKPHTPLLKHFRRLEKTRKGYLNERKEKGKSVWWLGYIWSPNEWDNASAITLLTLRICRISKQYSCRNNIQWIRHWFFEKKLIGLSTLASSFYKSTAPAPTWLASTCNWNGRSY